MPGFKKKSFTRKTKKSVDKKQTKQIKQLVQIAGAIEPKQHQDYISQAAVANTFYVLSFNNIAQGTATGTRVGDKINIVEWCMRLSVVNTSATLVSRYRYLVIRIADQSMTTVMAYDADRYLYGGGAAAGTATPSGEINYNIQTAGGGAGSGLFSYKNKKNKLISIKNSLKLLYDSGIHNLAPQAGTPAIAQATTSSYFRCHNHKKTCNYAARYNSGGAGSEANGSIVVMFIANNTTTFNVNTNILYIDS